MTGTNTGVAGTQLPSIPLDGVEYVAVNLNISQSKAEQLKAWQFASPAPRKPIAEYDFEQIWNRAELVSPRELMGCLYLEGFTLAKVSPELANGRHMMKLLFIRRIKSPKTPIEWVDLAEPEGEELNLLLHLTYHCHCRHVGRPLSNLQIWFGGSSTDEPRQEIGVQDGRLVIKPLRPSPVRKNLIEEGSGFHLQLVALAGTHP